MIYQKLFRVEEYNFFLFSSLQIIIMTSQDAKQLSNFFTPKIDLLDKNTYSEVSFVQLPDGNQGSYTSNQISYNTITLAQNFIVLADSILFIPFQIKVQLQLLLQEILKLLSNKVFCS